jgi:alcohol dehydrogenase class IV
MGLNFEFATATQIIFGRKSVRKVPHLLSNMGNRILLVTGRNTGRARFLTDNLAPDEFDVYSFSVFEEPSTHIISEGVAYARESGCEAVVGFGGGSVIDCAKAIAALVPNEGKLHDYLEVIGLGKPLEKKPLPFIAIPTTSGTGAEVTKNAVILSPQHRVKVSLRSPLMFPDVAVVDPELTVTMSPHLTAVTGMDALTHLLETYVSNQSNPSIDELCREGLRLISASLMKAFNDGTDMEARENMAFASMLGGLALANVKLGAVHGFAGPIGGMFPVQHGAVCAALLPGVMKVNFRAVREQNLQHIIKKYEEIGRLLTGKPDAKAEDGIRWITETMEKLNIPRLSAYGIDSASFPLLVKKAKNASSMKGNPVELNDEQLMEIMLESK